MSSCFKIGLEICFSMQKITWLYYVWYLIFYSFTPKIDMSRACMYSDFYEVYVMMNSDLHASEADLELYCTNASMHLVSHLDRCMHSVCFFWDLGSFCHLPKKGEIVELHSMLLTISPFIFWDDPKTFSESILSLLIFG